MLYIFLLDLKTFTKIGRTIIKVILNKTTVLYLKEFRLFQENSKFMMALALFNKLNFS